MAARNPTRLSIPMIEVLVALNLFLIYVPKLLKRAVDRFAASPNSAISFSESPCPSKMMPKRAPQVQFMPTILPQQINTFIVSLWFLVNAIIPSMKLFSGAGDYCDYSFAYILSLSLAQRQIVIIEENNPMIAMIKLRELIRLLTSQVDRFSLSEPVIQIMSYRIQKLMPRAGRKRGIEAAQPLCSCGKSLRSPQGALMIGICAMATMIAINSATAQFVPAKQRPIQAKPMSAVDPTTQLQQCLLNDLKMKGVNNTWKMLKELEKRSTIVLLVSKNFSVQGRMAKYCPQAMRIAVETSVTDRIKHQANILYKLFRSNPFQKSLNLIQKVLIFVLEQWSKRIIFIQCLQFMSEQGAFFSIPITDELVQSLDNLAYIQLLEVLQLNFQQEYHQLSKLRQQKQQLTQEINTGEGNINKLASLALEHQKQRLKLSSELELLEAECQAAKRELKHEES